MVTSLLLGFASVFFILGHSTLVFFKAKEISAIPLADFWFPRPRQGKFVSYLCISLSAAALFGALFWFRFSLPLRKPGVWKILFVLTLFPWGAYLSYVLKRIRKDVSGKLNFYPLATTRGEWIVPFLLIVLGTLSFWLI